MSALWNSVRAIRMLIVSTLMALIAALVNKDILEMEESVKVIILEIISKKLDIRFCHEKTKYGLHEGVQ